MRKDPQVSKRRPQKLVGSSGTNNGNGTNTDLCDPDFETWIVNSDRYKEASDLGLVLGMFGLGGAAGMSARLSPAKSICEWSFPAG